ncbi:MAG: FAD:protein FMN transferase [Bacteroidales bacterium]|nr:FAD:protein FMN transferase [Bacteroidales bacterium]
MRTLEYRWMATILLLAAGLLLLAGCRPRPVYVRFSGMALGTTYSIAAQVDRAGAQAWPERVAASLDLLESSLSTFRPSSVISMINSGQSARTDSMFRQVFRAARIVHDASDGFFDITVTPLVNAWGFGFAGAPHRQVPQASVDSLLQMVGMDKVHLSADTIVKEVPGVMLDMSAIAKGFAVDVVARLFEEAGCQDYMVEIGGEVRTSGRSEAGRIWRIGIDSPVDRAMPGDSLQTIIQLDGKSMATSGNYRQFFEVDGIRYAHTINPKTGCPTQDSLLSVTIVTDNAMMADAWATACMASGYAGARRLLASRPELDALLIYGGRSGNKVYMTSGFTEMVLH